MSGAQRPLSSQSASLIDNVILATTSLFAPAPAASTAPPQTTNCAEDMNADDDRTLPGEDATPSRPEDPRQKANGTPGPRTPGHDAVVAAISRIPSGGEERPMSPLPPMSPQMRGGSALREILPSARTSAFTDTANAAQTQGIPPNPGTGFSNAVEAPHRATSPVAPPPAQKKSAPMRPPLPDCFAPVITTIQTVVPSVLPSPQTAIVDEDAVLPCVPPSPKPRTAPVPEVPPELPEAPATAAPKSAVQMPPAPPLPPSAPTPTATADEDTPLTVSALLARRARGKARALASEGAAPAPTQPTTVSPAAPVAVQAPLHSTPAQQVQVDAPDGEKDARQQQQKQQQPPPSSAPGSVLVPSAPKPLPAFPSSFIKSSPAAAFHALKPKAASTVASAAVAAPVADDAPLTSTAELSEARGNAPATAAAPAMFSPSDPAAAPAAAPAGPPSAPPATTPEPSAALAPVLMQPAPAVAASTTGAATAGESATRICRSCNGVVSGAFCPHCEGADLSRERGRRRSGSPPRRRDRRGADDDEDGYRREERGRRRRRSRTPRSPSPDGREARRDRRSDRRARERGRRMRGRRLRSHSRSRSMSTDSFASTASSASTVSSTSPEPSPMRGHEPPEQKRMKLRAIVEFGARKAAKAEARRAFQETMAKALRAAGEDPELDLPELSHEAKGFDGAVGRTGRDFDHSAAEFARFWVDTVSVDGVDVPSVLLRETAGLSDESVTCKSRCEDDIELACPRGYDCPKIHFRDVAIRDVGRVSCGWYEPTIGLLKYAGSANLQGGLCRFHAPGALCQKGRLCSYLHRLDVTRVHAAQGASDRGAHADDTAPALDAPMAPAAKRTHSDPWADMVVVDGIAYPVTLLTSPAGDGARCPKGLECSTDMPCPHAHFKPISVKTLGVVSAGEFEPTDGLVHFTSRGTGKEAWLCRHFRESNRAACSNGHRCSFVHLRPDARVTKSDDPGKSGWLSAADMVPVDWTDSVIVDNVPFPRALLKPTAALQPSSSSASIACARCPRDPHCPHAERCTKAHFKTLTVRSLGVASAGDFSVTMGLVHFATRFPERESYFCKDHGVQGRVCARGADCSFIHAVRSAPLASGAPAVMGHTEQAHVSLPSTITVDDVVYSRLLLLDTAGLMAFRGETDGGVKVGQRCPEDLHCTRGPSCPMIHFKPLTVRGNGVMSAGQFVPTQGLSHYTLRAPQKEAWVCRNYAPGRQCPAGNSCTFVHPREVTSIRGANAQGGAFGPDASAAAPVPQPIVAAAGSVMIEGFPYLPRLLSDTAGLRRAYALPSDLRARSDLRRCRFGLQCPRGADCDDIHFKQVLVKEIGPMSAGDCEPTVGLEKFVASQKEAWVCHHHGRRSGAPCSASEQCTFIHLRGMVPTARPVAVPAPEPPMQAYHAGGHNHPSAPQHAPRYASAPVAEPFEDPRPQRLPPHDEDAAVDDAAITAFGPARPSAVAEAAPIATAPPPYAAPPAVGHRSVAPPVPQGHIPGMRPPPSYTQPAPPQYTRAVPAAPPRAEAQYGGRSFAQSAAAPHGASYDHSREPAMRPRDAEPQYVHGRGAEVSAPPSEGHVRYVPRGSYSDAAGAYRPGDEDAVAAAPPRRGAYTHHPYDDKPQPPPPSYY